MNITNYKVRRIMENIYLEMGSNSMACPPEAIKLSGKTD